MKLLIASLHYAPEQTGNAPYVTGLAEELARRGHSITVLTGFPSYPASHVQHPYRGRLRQRERLNGVDVRRVWHYLPTTQTALSRGVAEGSFVAAGLSLVALPRPDAVVGVSPSLSGAIVARLAAHYYRVPYGLILQDLMAPAAGQSGVRGGGLVAGLVRRVERWALGDAAAVGIVAEGFRPYVESLGIDPRRIRRVRNWTHVSAPAIDRSAARDRLALPQEAFVCLHAGNMGAKQGLENVLRAARIAAREEPRLLFTLLGDGNQRSSLERLASGYGLPNLRFLPMQPSGFYPSALAAADVLLVNQRASVEEMSLPSKLTSYFAVGRPIVGAVKDTSEAAHEIEASGAGVVVAPEDPRALLVALSALARDGACSAALGEAGRAWATAMLSRGHAMEQYRQLIDTIVQAGQRRAGPVDQVAGEEASAGATEPSRGESDGEHKLLVRQVSPRHGWRRLSRPVRGAGAEETGREPRLRAA